MPNSSEYNQKGAYARRIRKFQTDNKKNSSELSLRILLEYFYFSEMDLFLNKEVLISNKIFILF